MVEINNQTKSKIDLASVKKAAEKFLKIYKQGEKEVSIAFVGDSVIRRLNKTYRKIDKATDILTFSADGGASVGDGDFLGEVIIDYDQIKKQAKQSGHSIKKELIFILVHGLLHLVGYSDETERGRREMIKRGEAFMGELKFKN